MLGPISAGAMTNGGRGTRTSQFYLPGSTSGCISAGLRRDESLSCDDLQTTELCVQGRCVYRENHRTGACFMEQSPRQRTWKNILHQKQKGNIFLFSKSRDLWLVMQQQQGDAGREDYLRKRQTSRKLWPVQAQVTDEQCPSSLYCISNMSETSPVLSY